MKFFKQCAFPFCNEFFMSQWGLGPGTCLEATVIHLTQQDFPTKIKMEFSKGGKNSKSCCVWSFGECRTFYPLITNTAELLSKMFATSDNDTNLGRFLVKIAKIAKPCIFPRGVHLPQSPFVFYYIFPRIY